MGCSEVAPFRRVVAVLARTVRLYEQFRLIEVPFLFGAALTVLLAADSALPDDRRFGPPGCSYQAFAKAQEG
jgi:hypothetical protein